MSWTQGSMIQINKIKQLIFRLSTEKLRFSWRYEQSYPHLFFLKRPLSPLGSGKWVALPHFWRGHTEWAPTEPVKTGGSPTAAEAALGA